MLMMKFIGKPYAGKLHVRFDEGVGKEFYPSRSTLPKPNANFSSTLQAGSFAKIANRAIY
jgi:hypothetical protein